MKIRFKSGKEIEVPKEVIESLKNKLVKGGASKFQTYSYKDGECFLIINLDEVEYASE